MIYRLSIDRFFLSRARSRVTFQLVSPVPSPSSRASQTAERHAVILAEALELMAERGYHGASLRELAKRLGISQPSLYHYFASKDELVEQIIEAYSGRMFAKVPPIRPDDDIEDLPDLLRRYILDLYAEREHPTFVRFVFAVSRIDPRFGRLNRDIFVTRGRTRMLAGLRPLAERSGVELEQLTQVLQAVVNAIGFRLMEETVLFDEQPIGEDTHRFADEVAAMARARLHMLRTPK